MNGSSNSNYCLNLIVVIHLRLEQYHYDCYIAFDFTSVSCGVYHARAYPHPQIL